jgi:hypothetical protein
MVSLGTRSYKRIETEKGDERILVEIEGFGPCELKEVKGEEMKA